MEDCIIETLTYFDIFDYPLTFSELKKYLCCEIDVNDEDFHEIINSIAIVQESNGYFYLLGRNAIPEKRIERSSIAIQKFAKAKIIAKILAFIPTIEYIGASGSLSMNNTSISDDIDLFFITKKNTLWITRLLVDSTLLLLRQKRRRNEKDVRDKICPNMFVAQGKLSFSRKRRTLYTAHEIVQLKTLFDRDDNYSLLLNKNKWVEEFFPNIPIVPVKSKKTKSFQKLIQKIILPVEKLFFLTQNLYMKKHQSIETVTKNRAFFHPVNRQKLIMEMYALRVKRYKILYTDNLWVDRDEARFYMQEKKIRILN